ncbi:Aldo/keto reductase family protein [Epsilonproteobacteria bacterium SCGC AD-311-C15]|jgi:aryl-alcohol dehydrogenase-like predicted oxidoreductase|nr:Aldo/keto reductase family protein [Epsilonproteobacteria bacterium SCGC AD-311-C15]
MSNFAFGTYRISDYNPQHIEALKAAISSGITMIDTSSNYMDGGAERAIALAFRDFDDEIKANIKIVSKYGYIQGTNMSNHKEMPFEEVVEFSEDCYHSISKPFMKNQLSESLSRLEMKKIDCYLLHNPEYYLLDAINKNIDYDTRLDEMYRRLYEAFIGLEEEVQNGRIFSYGISSNSFSKSHDSEEFLPYEDLLTLADKAAKYVGNDMHSFSTIELPINLLERDGLKCASWAKENGLRVLVNRPLNAQYNGMMYRLADYEESIEYFHYLNELMGVCDNEELKPLYTLLEQLDANKHKFGWIGDYDSFLYAQIIPHIRKSLEVLEDAEKENMFNYIDLFLKEYREMVLYECSKNTKLALEEFLDGDYEPLQKSAINYLLKKDEIDYILVGMRKPSYVYEIMALKG